MKERDDVEFLKRIIVNERELIRRAKDGSILHEYFNLFVAVEARLVETVNKTPGLTDEEKEYILRN